MRVLVTGASGFIGRAAVSRLLADGHSVVALSRDPRRHRWPVGVLPVEWDARSLPPVDGPVGAVVHLAGENVGKRWTRSALERMRDSRVGVAQRLVEWMAARDASERPSAYVSASAVGYYGLAPVGARGEGAPPGDDLLAQLCRDWEDAGRAAEGLGARAVFLRFGIVLHPDGGALRRLLLPFRLGLGGPIGAGSQPFPWVHRDDAAAAVAWAVANAGARGPYNVTAPQATDMQGLAKSLAAALHRPAFMRVPGIAVKAALGTGAAEVVLGGQDAPSDRILRDGFRFRHPDLSPALHEMLGR